MRDRIIIHLDEITYESKEQLLTTLWNIEDDEGYECASISKAISILQELITNERKRLHIKER